MRYKIGKENGEWDPKDCEQERCIIFIGSIVTELTTQESRRLDTFVTH